MSDLIKRSLVFRTLDSAEPIWVVKDTVVPLVGDEIVVRQSDGRAKLYEVMRRRWAADKKGTSDFPEVHLIVEAIQTLNPI